MVEYGIMVALIAAVCNVLISNPGAECQQCILVGETAI